MSPRPLAEGARPSTRGGAPAALALALALALAPSTARAHEEIVPPKLLRAQPVLPLRAPAREVVVPLVITVRTDGTVAEARVEASVDPDLDLAAVDAVRTWTFEPARRGDAVVEARIRIAIRFRVAEGAPAEGPRAPVAPVPDGDAPAASVVDHGLPTLVVDVHGEVPARAATAAERRQDILTAAPHRTASDALATLPGLFVTQHSGEGKANQLFLRGFDAVHGQDVEIWVAGAPVNDVSNVHGQGYADLHFVMPEVIRRMELLPGTYDPRQGDFAVAGTVRLDLGLAEPGVHAKIGGGSFGARRLFVAYRPENRSEGTFAAFEGYQTDGFGPSRAAERASVLAQGTAELGGLNVRVMGSAYATRFDSAGAVPLADLRRGRIDRFGTYSPDQGGASSRAQVVVELGREDERSRWTLAPFFIARSLRLRQDFTGYLVDPVLGDATEQRNDASTVGLTSSYRVSTPVFSRSDALEAGVFARSDWITQSQRRARAPAGDPSARSVEADVRALDVAGWIDGALHPFRRLAVRGGLRVDGLSFTTDDETPAGRGTRTAQGFHAGGKGTVDFALFPGLHALASAGQGFRSPQARSLGDAETIPFTRVLSTELGLRYRGPRGIVASAGLFRTTLSEDLVFDHLTGRNDAVPSTARTGVALNLEARPTRLFTTALSATYTRAVFTDSGPVYRAGELVPYAPKLVARSDSSLRAPLFRVGERTLEGRLGAAFSALAGRPLPFGDLGSDVFLVDASAGLGLGPVELGLDAYNLLDRAWFDGDFAYPSRFDRAGPLDLLPARHVTVGPPRILLVTLSIHAS